jgi:vacuolar-type H+-ATPase subunit I/STV1
MFIDGDGDPVEDCELRLTLKDFVSGETASEIGDFEAVPIKIPSKELHRFYKRSLQPHVCAEIDDEQELIREEVKEDLENISEVEKILKEPEVPTSGRERVVGLEGVEKVRESLNKAQQHISKRRVNMEDLKEKLERVGDKKSKDVQEATEKLGEAEIELAELEKKISDVERKTRRASEANAARPSVSQSSSGAPIASTKPVRKSKARLSWSRKKEGQS